jgi:hypothetical protein
MNKWIRNIFLTEDEKLVLKLYENCQRADFTRHFEVSTKNCFNFTDIVQKTDEVIKGGDSAWTTASKGKISATAFLKGSENNA